MLGRRAMSDYQHAEAFCLMTYRTGDGTEEERIWNSRDGVTPLLITLRSGRTAMHVDWRSDRPDPDYQPPVGSRIFVSMSKRRCRRLGVPLGAPDLIEVWA